jgi:hypothetical protein
MRSTTWRKAVSIEPWEPFLSVNGERIHGAESTAGLIPTDVPGETVKAMLRVSTSLSVPEGWDKAPGADPKLRRAVDDPHRGSKGSGEDEGLMIQSLIENAEEDALRSASTTRLPFSRAGGERRKCKAS